MGNIRERLANWLYPTTPNHARLRAQPGVTLDLVDKDGTVQVKVVLSQITRDSRNGTTVEFEDYFKAVGRWDFRG